MPKPRRRSFPAETPTLRRRAGESPEMLPHRAIFGFLLLFCAPLLLVYLGTGDAVDMMELFNLVPVHEAFRDHHWLMPTLNGMPRLEKPPLPVWIPAAFAAMAGNDSLWVLRAPSVLMALLTAGATYWIGCIISPGEKNRPFAMLAACITMTMLVFLRHARLASYDIYSTAFLTLGMAGLFGMTEHASEPAGTRRAWAYTILAGVGIGLSILSKGPVPVATICLPFGLYMLIFHRRPRVWLQLIIAALVSVCVFLPWLLAIGHDYAAYDPWGVWYREILQNSTAVSNNPAQTAADLKKSRWYYLLFPLWAVPHVVSFVAGLILPWVTRNKPEEELSAREKRGRWALWMIVVGGLLFVSCLAEKKPRYALPVFPFAGLLCAAVWQDFFRWPKERKLDLGAWLVLMVQALFFILPAIAGLVLVSWSLSGAPLPAWAGGQAVAEALHTFPPAFSFVLLLLLLASGVYFWRSTRRRDWAAVLLMVAVASWLFTFTLESIYRADPGSHTNPVRVPVEQAMQIAGQSLVFTTPEQRPWLSTLYYANRELPEENVPTLIKIANAGPQDPFFLMIVTGTDVKPSAKAQATLREFEAGAHRQPTMITTWYDEGRHTAMYGFSPIAPATASAPASSPATQR